MYSPNIAINQNKPVWLFLSSVIIKFKKYFDHQASVHKMVTRVTLQDAVDYVTASDDEEYNNFYIWAEKVKLGALENFCWRQRKLYLKMFFASWPKIIWTILFGKFQSYSTS